MFEVLVPARKCYALRRTRACAANIDVNALYEVLILMLAANTKRRLCLRYLRT